MGSVFKWVISLAKWTVLKFEAIRSYASTQTCLPTSSAMAAKTWLIVRAKGKLHLSVCTYTSS